MNITMYFKDGVTIVKNVESFTCLPHENTVNIRLDSSINEDILFWEKGLTYGVHNGTSENIENDINMIKVFLNGNTYEIHDMNFNGAYVSLNFLHNGGIDVKFD